MGVAAGDLPPPGGRTQVGVRNGLRTISSLEGLEDLIKKKSCPRSHLEAGWFGIRMVRNTNITEVNAFNPVFLE